MIQTLQTFLENYTIIAPIVFIFIRIFPVVIPPIPGLLVDAVGVIVFGWFYGFIYAMIGIVTASMIAFFIGRKFREPLISKFISIQKIHEFEDKLSDGQKFWTLVGIRFVSTPFFDIVNYIAGLTKIKASHYFLSSVLVTTPMTFMIYFFGGVILNKSFIIISSIIVVIAILILYKNKKANKVADML